MGYYENGANRKGSSPECPNCFSVCPIIGPNLKNLFKPFDLHYKVFRILVAGLSVISLVHIIIYCLKPNARCSLSFYPLFKFPQKHTSNPFVLALISNDYFLKCISDNIIVLFEVSHHKTNHTIKEARQPQYLLIQIGRAHV